MDLQKYAKLWARSHNGAKITLKFNIDHFRSIVVTIAYAKLRPKLAGIDGCVLVMGRSGFLRKSTYVNLLQGNTCLNL